MATHISIQLSYSGGASASFVTPLSETAATMAEHLITQIREDEQAQDAPVNIPEGGTDAA